MEQQWQVASQIAAEAVELEAAVRGGSHAGRMSPLKVSAFKSGDAGAVDDVEVDVAAECLGVDVRRCAAHDEIAEKAFRLSNVADGT